MGEPARPDYNIFGRKTEKKDTIFYGLGYIAKDFSNFQSTSVPLELEDHFKRYGEQWNWHSQYNPEIEGEIVNPFEEDRLKIYVQQTKLNGMIT